MPLSHSLRQGRTGGGGIRNDTICLTTDSHGILQDRTVNQDPCVPTGHPVNPPFGFEPPCQTPPTPAAMSSLAALLRAVPRPLRRQRLLAALVRSGLFSNTQLAVYNGESRAWVDLRDAESRAVFLSGSFWPEFPPLVAAFLPEHGCFFDVGANFGLVSFGLLPLVAGRAIQFHLFEANSEIVPSLLASAREWPDEQVIVNYSCVTDCTGNSRINVASPCWGHGHVSETGLLVSNVKLDDYLLDRAIEHVDFLKLDVEGWEVRALSGGKHALEAGRVRAAFVEVATLPLARAGASPGELLAQLDGLGFDCYTIALRDPMSDTHQSQVEATVIELNGLELRLTPAQWLASMDTQTDVLALHRSGQLAQFVHGRLVASR